MSLEKSLPHGLLLVNKPSGITSHDVVAKIRKIFSTKSVGHTGTLDPLAAGVMVLLLGEATKLSQYILEGDKAYRVKMKLGLTTDTLDITGKIISEQQVAVSQQDIENIIPQFAGEHEFSVPLYSAIKVQGQKLYEYARQSEEVTVPKKLMKFWNIKILSIEIPIVEFEVHCSKGSYIRTLVDEIGKRLKCGAVMTELTRIWSDPYRLDQTKSLEELQNSTEHSLIPMCMALPKVKKIKIQGLDQKLLCNGQISHDLRIQLIRNFIPEKDQLIQIVSEDTKQILALIGLHPDKGFEIKRVFRS